MNFRSCWGDGVRVTRVAELLPLLALCGDHRLLGRRSASYTPKIKLRTSSRRGPGAIAQHAV